MIVISVTIDGFLSLAPPQRTFWGARYHVKGSYSHYNSVDMHVS